MPWASRRIDRLSHKFLVPRYARKADAIIAVSEITREHVIEFLPIPAERVFTVYSGVDDSFRQPTAPEARVQLQKRYDLPSRFFLYSGAIYPPKNFTRLVQAYAKVGPAAGISLVIAGGENRFLSEHELKVPDEMGLTPWVKWLGWVDPGALADPVSDGRGAAVALAVRVLWIADRRSDGVRLPGPHRRSLWNQGNCGQTPRFW